MSNPSKPSTIAYIRGQEPSGGRGSWVVGGTFVHGFSVLVQYPRTMSSGQSFFVEPIRNPAPGRGGTGQCEAVLYHVGDQQMLLHLAGGNPQAALRPTSG